MDVEILVPIGFFAMVVLIIWLFQMYASRKRSEAFQTLRVAIEKGQQVTPEAMEALTRLAPPNADLRRGILFVALAAAFGAMAFIFREFAEEATRSLLGVAVFPLFLGLAFIGLHVFANPKK
jgi:ACR3 family arsenite efflux pump ArsB